MREQLVAASTRRSDLLSDEGPCVESAELLCERRDAAEPG